MAHRLSILVVDDEFDFAALLAELLEARGHRVTTAINGLLGISLIRSNHYDLVITDFMMPMLDGIEMVKAMRAEPQRSGVPVILISAQKDVVSGLGEGVAQAALHKPFSPSALYAAIDRVAPGA